MGNYHRLLSFLAAFLLLAACDKVEGPYLQQSDASEVLIEKEHIDASTVYRKILIEEYTGHTCIYCPNGRAKLDEMKEIFGDTLVVVAVHATTLAAPEAEPFTYDFRTPAGNELAEYYEIEGLPKAIINRHKSTENGEYPEDWRALLHAVDRSDLKAALHLTPSFNKQTNKLSVTVKTNMLTDYSAPLNLSLFVIEDSIVKPQKKSGVPIIYDYVHNHVLRSGINGTFGRYLTTDGILEKDYSYTITYQVDFAGKDWNSDKCSVVAILYDKTDYNVLQSEVAPITSGR